jgi:flagellar hook-basal body complex protein FliE
MQILPVNFIEPMTFSKIGDPEMTAEPSAPFAEFFKEALGEYASLQKTADADSAALALGEADNLAQIQINTLKAEAALQTTVQLTSRAVNAYKEIMQMSV